MDANTLEQSKADIPDAPPPEGADLLTLERELIRSVDAFSANPCDFPDKEFYRWGHYNARLEDRIAEMPAKSYADVAVKLRRMKQHHQENGTDNSWTESLVDTALEALERLGRAS